MQDDHELMDLADMTDLAHPAVVSACCPTYRLGQTDILVSRLGLGTVKFGRNTGVKYPTSFELPSDRHIQHLLACAIDHGINLLDTAPAYGASESRLGQALKGQRHRFVISTKAGEQFIDGQSRFDFTERAITDSVHHSLKALQTDYLDIVLIHSNGEDERLIREYAVFESLKKLKQAGKIRAFGMSTKTVSGGKLAVEEADVVMVTFNLMHQAEAPVLLHAATHQKGVFIKKALMSGHLPMPDHADHTDDADQASPVVAALHFVFKQPAVSSVIIGTLDTGHLLEAISSLAP